MRLRLVGMLAVLAASVGSAANIITVTGSNILTVPGVGTLWVTSWTQTTGYQNVTITAPLIDATAGGPIGGTEGTVYLVNQVGPGTTAANNVAPPITISGLTSAASTQTLWTGLTLPAGTYYVLWDSVHLSSCSMCPSILNSPTISVGTGVTSLPITTTPTAPASFPPATGGLTAATFAGEGFALTVTGNPAGSAPPAPTPAPTSLVLLLTGLCGAGIYHGVKSRGTAQFPA